MASAIRRCRRCGALLAADHDFDEWCSPCLRRGRDYDPRDDPQFLDKLLWCLASAPATTVRPLQALGIAYEHREIVKEGIRALRRRGCIIEARPRQPGYRYMGMRLAPSSSAPAGLRTSAVGGR